MRKGSGREPSGCSITSLVELVQAGAAPDAIRRAQNSVVLRNLAPRRSHERRTVRCGPIPRPKRRATGAPPGSVGIAIKCADLTSYYLYDLCALCIADDEDHDKFDEDGMNLLHHAALCGAEPVIVGMILDQNRDTANDLDLHGFLPLHYAAMCGSSTAVMRMLLAGGGRG